MRILVDTNVLVRSVERAHPFMRIARDSLRHLYEEAHELCVTPQNVSEFWNVCTRPLKMNGLGNGISATDRLAARIESFFTILPDSIETFRRWRELVVAHEVKGAKGLSINNRLNRQPPLPYGRGSESTSEPVE